MRASLTGYDIFNTVMLQRSLDKRLVVVVESPEDTGTIDPHMNERDIQTFPGYGKESVLTAAQMFLSHQVSDVVVLIDADLDRYIGHHLGYPKNVLMTEFYDLDADVLIHCPQALSATLANFTDRSKRQSYLASRGMSANEIIWDMAIAVGEIRYCSVVRQCGLNLRGFPLHEVIDGYEQGTIRASTLTLALARTVDAADITTSDVATDAAAIPDKRYIASGHDLMSALAAFIRKRWGGTPGEKILASALRSAVQCQCWRNTSVYKSVEGWASQLKVDAWTCK